MSAHDEQGDDRNFARLRREYASLPKAEPGADVDAAIHAAARAHARKPWWPTWSAAAGLAACVGLAVVLVPVLLIEAPRESSGMRSTELVIVSEPAAEDVAVRQQQRETAARARIAPSSAPQVLARRPAPEALAEGKGELSMAHEEWIAREEIAPAEPEHPALADNTDAKAAAPSGLERVLVTGSRIRNEDAERAGIDVDAIRAELAEADATAWRERLLALREQGNAAAAEELLKDYRERFHRPDDFTLDDLAQERISNE